MITVEEPPYDIQRNEQVYIVHVPLKGIENLQLDPIERAVLSDPPKDAADLLQDLSIVAFRQQQQMAPKAREEGKDD